MDIITELLIDEAFIVVGALLILGKIIKEIPNIPDWSIPIILLAFGELGAIALMGANPDAFLQGIIVTGLAVYGHQLVTQTMERSD